MKYLITFLVGAILGGIFIKAWQYTRVRELQPAATEQVAIVDGLVDEWTAYRDGNIAAIAGCGQFRRGYIPDTVVALARRIDSLYKVPKGVTTAQWILESSWGMRNLGAENYFGHTFNAVKPFMTDPRWVTRRELIAPAGMLAPGNPVRFAAYGSMAQCFETHGRYLSGSRLYRSAFAAGSPEQFAREIARRYATDPEYALKLIIIMRRYHLN